MSAPAAVADTTTRSGDSPSDTVVTGIGVVASNGIGVDAWWAATLSARSGIDRVTRFDPEQYPATLAGEIDADAIVGLLPSRLMPQTDPMTRLALVAAEEAFIDAHVNVDEGNSLSMGVMTAASGGGIEFGQRELENMWAKGKQHVSAFQSFAWFYAVNTGQISIRHGLRGPSGVVVSDQAGSLDALGQARRSLRRGSELMLSGGVDGAICPWGWLAQLATRRVSPVADPSRAYRPFAVDATGFVPAEGGAMFVLESRSRALARGVGRSYGRFAGYAATFDTVGEVPGTGLAQAAMRAMADAGCTVDDIDLVLPDAVGVPELDRAEIHALNEVFGARPIAISVPKSLTGRALAGGGALDIAAGLLALRDQVAPPSSPACADAVSGLDVVGTRPREMRVNAVLVLARGFGGFNSAVVLTAP